MYHSIHMLDNCPIYELLGLCLLVFQFTVYPFLEKIFGPIVLARIAGVNFEHSGIYSCLAFNIFMFKMWSSFHNILCTGFDNTPFDKLHFHSKVIRIQSCLADKLCFCNKEFLNRKCITLMDTILTYSHLDGVCLFVLQLNYSDNWFVLNE